MSLVLSVGDSCRSVTDRGGFMKGGLRGMLWSAAVP